MSPTKKKPRGLFNPHAVERSDDANAFIPDPGDGPAHTDDELAESMAEDFLQAATTAQDPDEARLDSSYPEEIGGPFIETSAAEELAHDTDGNNPPDATREPMPRAVAGIVAAPDVDDPTEDESSDLDDLDGGRDPADPGISAREADPARTIEDLNEETGGGRTPT